MNIRDKVVKILINTIANDYSEVNKSELLHYLEFNDDLSKIEFNSVIYIKAVVQFEEEFDIEFDDGELLFSEMLSMEKICKTIKNHIESKKVAADDE